MKKFFSLILLLSIHVSVAYTKDSLSYHHPKLLAAKGYAAVEVEPDQAFISFGSSNQGKSVQLVKKLNTKTMNSIYKKLKKLGFNKSKIQTTRLDLHPVYEYKRQKGQNSSKRVLSGYQMEHIITVQVDNIKKLNGIVSSVTQNGADVLRDISFGISNRDKMYQRALKKAVVNAKNNAQSMAEAAGIKLGNIHRIMQDFMPHEPFRDNRMQVMTYAAPPSRVEISSGRIKVEAQVRILYKIQNNKNS